MFNVAVIGDECWVLPFKGLGVRTFAVTNQEEAVSALGVAVKEACAVVYIAEVWYKALEKAVREFDNEPFPIIVFLPDHRGSLGLGGDKLRRATLRALGRDTLIK